MKQEKFTEQAQQAIAASQQLLMRMQQNQWDVEHVLLALLQQEKGLVPEVIRDLGGNVDNIRRQVEAALNRMPKIGYQTGQVFATPRINDLFTNADAEAQRLKDEFIGTEHLLIAIAGEPKGEAAAILKQAGIDKEKIYRSLQKISGGHRVTDAQAES